MPCSHSFIDVPNSGDGNHVSHPSSFPLILWSIVLICELHCRTIATTRIYRGLSNFASSNLSVDTYFVHPLLNFNSHTISYILYCKFPWSIYPSSRACNFFVPQYTNTAERAGTTLTTHTTPAATHRPHLTTFYICVRVIIVEIETRTPASSIARTTTVGSAGLRAGAQ